MNSAHLVDLIGAGVAVGLGTLAYVLEKKAEKGSALNVAFLILILGALGTYLVSHDLRNAARLEDVIPRIHQESLRLVVRDIEELDKQLGAAAPEAERMYGVALGYVRRSLSGAIQEARSGTMTVNSKEEAINIAADLMAGAQERILVTSYILPEDWWLTPAGQTYGSRARPPSGKVKFERIYIVADDKELGSLKELIKQQRAAAIDVRVVKSAAIRKELRRDLLVIDGVVAAEMQLDKDRRFDKGQFWLQRTKAEDFAKVYSEVGLSAKRE